MPLSSSEGPHGTALSAFLMNLLRKTSAGSIASNLNDLELFFTHLYEKNTFIKRETFNKMIDYESEYGLGIELTRVGKNKVLFLGHDGDTFSFGIQNYYNTLTKDLIIVFF